MAGRTYSTEAVVLRSFRLGEADRVLHLYTLDRGRIGVVAKGIRKTKSRFGEDQYRLAVGLVGAEAMLRLFSEQECNPRAFQAVTRFLDLLDDLPPRAPRPALDPLALSFQLKLLWLSGYLPHLTSCADCGAMDVALVGYSARAGGAVCRGCAEGALALSPAGIAGIEAMLGRPLADAAAGISDRSARDALAVITAAYEYFGSFRLRALRSA